jgi:cytochrome P450
LRRPRRRPAPFDLKRLPAGFIDDPYPYFHALREHDPVHRMPDGSYIITRYDDCETLYKDAKTYSSDKKIEFRPKFGDTPLFQHHTTSLVFNDPPLHTQVRRAIAGALSPRAIAEMEIGLVELVDRLLNELELARGERRVRVDLIEDFASAIPVEIIGNLLGVPHHERGPLRAWSLAILGALEPVLTDAAAQGRQRRRHRVSRVPENPHRRPPPQSRRSQQGCADPPDQRASMTAASSPKPNSCRTASSFSMPATRPPPT